MEREEGRPLSFFLGERSHVALKAKELEVLRPHGQILRTGGGLTPDEAALTSTCWMAGVFHSMVTQGHVSINRFLSTTHGYLGLFRSHGQRLFVEIDGGWQLLDVPSAFEMAPQGCRWYYRHAGGLIRVESLAPADRHELLLSAEILEGGAVRFLLSSHVAINGDDGSDPVPVRYEQDGQGFLIRPIPECDVGRRFPEGGFRLDPVPGTGIERFGGDELLFADGRSRGQPFLCLLTEPARSMGFRITGHLVPEPEAELLPEERYWDQITAGLRLHPPVGSPLAEEAARLAEILPWLAHNALVHYLSPRGLEQYSGGGWGTRDVTQGPVEMLLALGRPEPIRDLLLRVFKQQNPDGDWPQWFMFFERERGIRPGRFPRRHRLLAPAGAGPVPPGLGGRRAPGPGPALLPSRRARTRRRWRRSARTSNGRSGSSATAASRAPSWPPTVTATGTTPSSRSTPPCGSACAAPGP